MTVWRWLRDRLGPPAMEPEPPPPDNGDAARVRRLLALKARAERLRRLGASGNWSADLVSGTYAPVRRREHGVPDKDGG